MSSSDSSPRFLTGCKAWLSGRVAPWTLLLIGVCLAALATGFASGCTRAVLVPESAPIRIGPETRAKIYTRDGGEWTLSDNRVEIPEGWYCVPPSFVEEEKR